MKDFKVNPDPGNFFNDLSDFIRTQEEPTISTGPYAQYKVMELVHKHVTVVLDGQGSDEMLAGYDPYYFVYFRQLIRERKYPLLIKELFFSRDIAVKYLKQKLLTALGIQKKTNANDLLNKEFLEKYKSERFTVISDNLKKRFVRDIFSASLQSLLRYEDKNAMRFSVEGRVPFLDFNLLRFIFSLDDSLIIRNGWNKYILRQSMKPLLPSIITGRRNKIGFTTPEYEWFMRMKNRIYSVFSSESFGRRPYADQNAVLNAFRLFIEGKINDTMIFWRFLNLELWFREFIDPPKKDRPNKDRPIFGAPNQGKNIVMYADNKKYLRIPVMSPLFAKGDDFSQKIATIISDSLNKLSRHPKFRGIVGKPFFVVVSEKIVAISQGRSYFLWEIKPSMPAKFLSKYVTRTPYGIGLGSPWTMQLAINEVGLPRILLATAISLIAKIFGKKGLFYIVAGPVVRSIDGPTEYSLYPSNVSAKLGPKDPDLAAKKISDSVCRSIKSVKLSKKFRGAAIIDANDLGQDILGNSTDLRDSLIQKIFKDNPMGQAAEQTPITIVFEEDNDF